MRLGVLEVGAPDTTLSVSFESQLVPQIASALQDDHEKKKKKKDQCAPLVQIDFWVHFYIFAIIFWDYLRSAEGK